MERTALATDLNANDMSRLHFIVNPLRPSIGSQWPFEEKKLERLVGDFQVHLVRGRRHAEMLARKAYDDGASVVCCVGGDSTLSEIVNGLYRAAQGGRESPHIALYSPLQRGDFIRSLPTVRPFEMIWADFEKGQIQEQMVDLLELEITGEYKQRIRRYAINSAGCGLSARLVHEFEKSPYVDRNRWNFIRLLAKQLPFYRHHDWSVTLDQKELSHPLLLSALIQNAQYTAHGLLAAPEASMSDGLLNLVMVRKSYRLQYLWSLLRLGFGAIPSRPAVERHTGREVTIQPLDLKRRVRVDYDGDVWGYLPMKAHIISKGLKILV